MRSTSKLAREVATEEQRWLKFIKDGERLDADHLPDWMQTVEMRQAMSTLKQFSDKERAYDAYQARQNYLRMQGSIERRQRELVAALAEERAAREAAVLEKAPCVSIDVASHKEPWPGSGPG